METLVDQTTKKIAGQARQLKLSFTGTKTPRAPTLIRRFLHSKQPFRAGAL